MTEYRTCIACNQVKSLENFKVNKTKCHSCYQEYHKNYQRKYRESNREKESARSRELYQINKSHILERKRKSYRKNRAANIARKLAWQKANPELCRLSSQKRRAKQKQNGVFEVTIKEAQKLLSGSCFYCNQSSKNLTLDHIIPIAKGGRHSIGNLVAACKPCNSSKNDKLLMEWKITKR